MLSFFNFHLDGAFMEDLHLLLTEAGKVNETSLDWAGLGAFSCNWSLHATFKSVARFYRYIDP